MRTMRVSYNEHCKASIIKDKGGKFFKSTLLDANCQIKYSRVPISRVISGKVGTAYSRQSCTSPWLSTASR